MQKISANSPRRGFHNDPRIHYCEPGWSWTSAPLPDLDCWCVLDGEGHLDLEHRTHPLRAGTCFLFAPGASPSARHNPSRPLTVFVVHLAPEAHPASAVPPVGKAPYNKPIKVTDTRRLRRLSELLSDSSPLDSEFKYEEAALALRQLFHLLANPQARQPSVDPRLERTRQQIHQRLAHAWTVEDMARAASLSPSRFNVLFKAHFAQSPLRYLIRARIDRAKNLLRETRMSQAEIAEALGYSDIYFFNRQFKKETGIPPGRYRGGDSMAR